MTAVEIRPVTVRDASVAAMVAALTDELALGGYSDDESFGYSLEQLAESGVHLVGAFAQDTLVGIGGVEVDHHSPASAELKRFYVSPAARGTGVGDRLLESLIGYAHETGASTVRLETGDQQHAALGFYRRHGFEVVPRFGPYVDSATSVCMERPVTGGTSGPAGPG